MTYTILNFIYAAQLVQHLVQLQPRPITLIVCYSRDHFLDQLYTALTDDQSHEEDGEGHESSPEPHPLLSTTLALITRSKDIKLVFCPKINSLRAYLSSRLDFTNSSTLVGAQKPLLAVLDLVALHHGTTECSVQGLSRSLALLIEFAASKKTDLLSCECKDIHDLENPYRGSRLWETQIPLLNGSVKLAGEGSKWAGRSISVKRVAGRWFQFARVEMNAEEAEIT